jgi:hypothetical protein
MYISLSAFEAGIRILRVFEIIDKIEPTDQGICLKTRHPIFDGSLEDHQLRNLGWSRSSGTSDTSWQL